MTPVARPALAFAAISIAAAGFWRSTAADPAGPVTFEDIATRSGVDFILKLS